MAEQHRTTETDAATFTTTTTTTAEASIEEDEDSYVDLMDVEEHRQLGSKTLTLTLTPKNETIGVKSSVTSALICATIQACSSQQQLPEAQAERTPVDIVVALDVSSSMMGGDKLALCKLTIQQLLCNLLPHDRFALIAYADDAVIKAHLQYMTADNKQTVLHTVKHLQAHGSTNISAAIALSFQELQSVPTSPNKVRSIFLLTDGHANRGISDPNGLVDVTKNCWMDSKRSVTADATSPPKNGADDHDDDADIKPVGRSRSSFFGAFRKTKNDTTVVPCHKVSTATTIPDPDAASPVSLVCFGYGCDHNAPMLRDISEATETGSYYYVQTDSDVSSAFGDALGGLVSIVAQSAVLTLIPPSPDVQIVCVHHDNAIRREDGFDSNNTTSQGVATYTVSVGDFYVEETRDVLVEVTLTKPTATSSEETVPSVGLVHLLATLSYTDMIKKAPIRSSKPIVCLIERPDNDDVSADNEYVAKQWIRVHATKEMEEAEKLAQRGQFLEAKRRLQGVKDLIAKAEKAVRDDVMVDQLAKDLQESMNGCMSTADYDSHGSKSLAYHQQTYKKTTHVDRQCIDNITLSNFHETNDGPRISCPSHHQEG